MAGTKVLAHDHPLLQYADTLTINFGDQKTEIRNEQVTQHNNLDCELNPIVNGADTRSRTSRVPRIRPVMGGVQVLRRLLLQHNTTEMLNDIREAVDDIEEETLG